MDEDIESLVKKANDKSELVRLESLIGFMMSVGSIFIANDITYMSATREVTSDVVTNYWIVAYSTLAFGMLSLGKAVFDCSKATYYSNKANSEKAKMESAKPSSQAE